MASDDLPLVIVHSPPIKKELATYINQPQLKSEAVGEVNDVKIESHGIKNKKNTRPSRRWLNSEVEKIIQKNIDLNNQLELRKDIEKSLLETKTRLEREIAILKSRKVTGATENQAIRERNKMLSQDVYLMKNILVKLNFELERYQDKIRKYEQAYLKPIDGGGGVCNAPCGNETHKKARWINGEVTIFAPLLVAYEESLREKNDLIKDLRCEIERMSGGMRTLIRENQEVQQRIINSEKQGEITYSDWVSLQKDLANTVEQNQLLARQAKLQQSKISELKSLFQSKLNEVSIERDDALDKLNHLKTETSILKGRLASLQEEFTRTKEDSNSRIPHSVHLAYLAECKRLLDELKLRHTEERDMLVRRLEHAELSKPNLERELSAVLGEKDVLSHKVISLTKDLRTLENKLLESEEKRRKMDKLKEGLKDRVEALSTFSKDLMKEHELTIRQLSGGTRLSLDLGGRLEEIKQQVKKVEMDTLEQIKLLDENITIQAARVDRLKTSHSSEVHKLQEALRVKDQELSDLRKDIQKKDEEIKLLLKTD